MCVGGCSVTVLGLCIAKVLTVQVVLRDTYCNGGTYSSTLDTWRADPPVPGRLVKFRLCAKVHLVQIVK